MTKEKINKSLADLLQLLEKVQKIRKNENLRTGIFKIPKKEKQKFEWFCNFNFDYSACNSEIIIETWFK